MRFYGYEAAEITAGTRDGFLDLDIDPKLAWALQNRGHFPVDINKGSREMLLRVPGFGVRTVDRLISARRLQPLRIGDLVRIGALTRKAKPFITVTDWTPGLMLDSADLRQRFMPAPKQLRLL